MTQRLTRQADYELNPYRRRGGEERVPTPASSVVGARVAGLDVALMPCRSRLKLALAQDDKQRWQSLGKASLHSNFMGSSLLGSLPQGLSVNERAKILQSTPLSPTLNLLSSMPSVRCRAACRRVRAPPAHG